MEHSSPPFLEKFSLENKILIRHPIDKGIFCEIDKNITEDDINKTVQKYHVTTKPVKMFKNNVQTHKIYVNDHLICHTNYITIETLNSIFNNSFIK